MASAIIKLNLLLEDRDKYINAHRTVADAMGEKDKGQIYLYAIMAEKTAF